MLIGNGNVVLWASLFVGPVLVASHVLGRGLLSLGCTMCLCGVLLLFQLYYLDMWCGVVVLVALCLCGVVLMVQLHYFDMWCGVVVLVELCLCGVVLLIQLHYFDMWCGVVGPVVLVSDVVCHTPGTKCVWGCGRGVTAPPSGQCTVNFIMHITATS